MTLRKKGILLGILCLLIGSLWYYFQGYKENGFINFASLGLLYVGWGILLLSIFGNRLINRKEIEFKHDKLHWLKDNLTKGVIYLSFGICMVGTIVLTDKFSSYRTKSILETEPTGTTIATVIKIETRHSRAGSELWAIIEYQTKAKTVEQSVFDYKEMYSVGQKYVVRYSIEYPEMFELIKRTD